jgi:hypothetical protein
VEELQHVVVGDHPHRDLVGAKAAALEELAVRPGRAHRDVLGELRDDAPVLQALQEEAQIGRVEKEAPARLQRGMDGGEDRHELLVAHVLAEVEGGGDVEPRRIGGAERDDVVAIEVAARRSDAALAPSRRVDEVLREVHAVVLGHLSVDDLPQHGVAAGEVRQDLIVPEVHERQEPLQARQRLALVHVDIGA